MFLDSTNPNEIVFLEIAGFADKVGSEASNLLLSEKRVNAVKDYFINAKKFKENQIETSFFGEKEGQKLEENRKVSLTGFYSVFKVPEFGSGDSCSFIFEHRTVSISPKANYCLSSILEQAKSKKNYLITIKTFSCGHEENYTVDGVKSKLNYSEARAKVVQNYFLRNGINAANIKTLPMGIDQTIEKKDNEHYKKRRAEIVLSY